MRKLHILALVTCMLLCNSCSKENAQTEDPVGTPVQQPVSLTSNFANWWSYNNKHIKLYEDFNAFDTDSKQIRTDDFMKSMTSGEYISVKYIGKDSSTHYKLYKLPDSADPNIKLALKGWMAHEYANYLLKGKPLPGLNYTDLQGKVFDDQTLNGKIVVLKFWFIGCKPCVAEMPELNKLVARYKDRKDIVFVSLAFDSAEKLKKFLTQKQFDYAVVAGQQDYIMNTLGIKAAPTHIILSKEGLVDKVVNSAETLVPLVDKIASQSAI
ncbi:TlpA family protein disulfide reductase [Dyadobacter sp. CY107]|uniref:TlpA family protein disulfide reductase n=1 Tax=Dyadobacter fanqingshengii TaxID=2906443 RepID=UPI001F35CB3C|nr:TlpA disulfide reductase family protein [Dyadobacter fanqingshengii]MCF2502138.1 TlpA family protein disulfide reductase [Dyadobacter fanqingshengii]